MGVHAVRFSRLDATSVIGGLDAIRRAGLRWRAKRGYKGREPSIGDEAPREVIAAARTGSYGQARPRVFMKLLRPTRR
jgi:hypothetical protein